MEAKGSIAMERSTDGVITIDLFGTKFKFKPDNDVDHPEQIIEELNHYVQNAEKHIRFTASDKNKLAILLLASMNMSNDLREIKLEHIKLQEHVMKRTSSLLEKIESNRSLKGLYSEHSV
ncbi:MAG: cell division protein ZapA [Desulfamplus sp.]|nr:cell division protein ZapA [Desulfamplus sp.]